MQSRIGALAAESQRPQGHTTNRNSSEGPSSEWRKGAPEESRRLRRYVDSPRPWVAKVFGSSSDACAAATGIARGVRQSIHLLSA